jgi:hypothetical protein
MSELTVHVEPESETPDDTTVVVVTPETSGADISGDALLELGNKLGEIEQRLLAVESKANEAIIVSEIAENTADAAIEIAATPEPEPEQPVIVEEPESSEPDPEPIQPQREHWWWRKRSLKGD